MFVVSPLFASLSCVRIDARGATNRATAQFARSRTRVAVIVNNIIDVIDTSAIGLFLNNSDDSDNCATSVVISIDHHHNLVTLLRSSPFSSNTECILQK